MAENEGLSRILRQPSLPEIQTSKFYQSTYEDARLELARIRDTIAGDVQSIREYLNDQRVMLDEMYFRLAQQLNDALVLTRVAANIGGGGGSILINSTSPVELARITVRPTADSRILLLGICDCALFSTTLTHNIVFEIYRGAVGGPIVATSQVVDADLTLAQWPNITRGIDADPGPEQEYVFTGRKVAAGEANTTAVAILLVGLNSQA